MSDPDEPGWYPTQLTPGMLQWFDGEEWQPRFQPTAEAKTADATRVIAIVLIIIIGIAVVIGVTMLLNALVSMQAN